MAGEQGFVRVLYTATGEEDLVALDGMSTAGELADAACGAVGVDSSACDVVLVDTDGGETVLAGDGTIGEVGIVGAEEVVEVRVSTRGAAQAKLALEKVGDYNAMASFQRALAEEEWEQARLIAMSGWVAEAPSGLHALGGCRRVPEAVAEELVDLLIDSGADVNGRLLARSPFAPHVDMTDWPVGIPDDATPSYIAAYTGSVGALRQLIKRGADINKQCEENATPIYMAAWEGHTDILQLLFDAGADVNAACDDGTTPCFMAAQEGHTEALELLIKAGCNIHSARDTGATPCVIAAEEGHAGALRMLIQAGADVNKACSNQTTACYMAAQWGHTNTLAVLIAAGADVNQACDTGATPCIIAAEDGDEEVLGVLIEAGADVNRACHEDGDTACITAAENGNAFVLRMLIEAGADVNAVREDGATACSVAAYRRDVAVLRLLRDAGADTNRAAREAWRGPLTAETHYAVRLQVLTSFIYLGVSRMLYGRARLLDDVVENAARPH